MLKSEPLSYTCEEQRFTGHLAYDASHSSRRPAILVVPTWMGLNAFARNKAEALTQDGYVGYAVDLFGDSKEATSPDEARKLITPLVADRHLIRKRLRAALEAIRSFSLVEPTQVAAIGFCFGGMCVLELAKSGCELPAVVSFHASLGAPSGLPMKPVETAMRIPASILLLHGYRDALAPEHELLKLQKELDERNVDWQVHIYGEAMHAFTNPKTHLPEHSLQYDEKAAHRAWRAMQNFLTEIFQTEF